MATLPEPNREAAERILAEKIAADAKRDAQRPVGQLLAGIVDALPNHDPRDLGSRTVTCPKHGEYVSWGRATGMRAKPELWTPCQDCEDERLRAEEAARVAAALERDRQRREQLIGAADIPERFRTRTFDNFVATTDGQRRALTVARDFAESFDPKSGAGLMFAGLPGTGKSHLAAAIMLALIGRHRVQYVTCMGMIRAVRDTWRRDSQTTERDVLREFGRTIDLLVIDEVGVQYGTDGEQTILFDVLDNRYSGMRPTILLTNQDREGFKACIGERIYDRLRETSRWVPFDWPSYRGKARSA